VNTVRRVSLLVVLAGVFAIAGLGDAPAQTSKAKTDTTKTADSAKATTLTFSIYKDKGGKFRWRLKDDAGVEVGMASKGYDAKADCQKTIDTIIAATAKAKVVDEAK
jgi:uncharacterized protein YegP (UPF0339 family)